jgi:hypothetical protein
MSAMVAAAIALASRKHLNEGSPKLRTNSEWVKRPGRADIAAV